MSGEVRKTPPSVEYRLSGEWAHLGPLTEAQVRELIARRKASSGTLATIGDDPTLTPLSEISAFADCFVTKLLPPSSGAPKSQLPALSARTGSALIVAEAARKTRRVPRWALVAVAAAAMAYGLTQLYGHFRGEPLPGCDQPAAIESALNALKPQHADFVSAATLRDIRALSSGQNERSCAASLVPTSGDRPVVPLEYRLLREDKALHAEITKADFPPVKSPPQATLQKPQPAPHAGPDIEVCHLKGEPTPVIAACSRLLARDSIDGVLRRDAFRSRGVAYYRRGDYDRALADLAESIRLAPDVAGLYGDQANIYYFKHDYSRAIAGYDKALKLDPSDALAFNNRGCAWVALGSLVNAEADFQRAREHGVADPGGACKSALASLRASLRTSP
jgi:tetratricopeptide (TPR) repeat protein